MAVSGDGMVDGEHDALGVVSVAAPSGAAVEDAAVQRALALALEDDDLARDAPAPPRRRPSMLPTARANEPRACIARRVRLDVGLGLLPLGGTAPARLQGARRFWDLAAGWGVLSVAAEERPTVVDEDVLLAILHLAVTDRDAFSVRVVGPADGRWPQLATRLGHVGRPLPLAEIRLPLAATGAGLADACEAARALLASLRATGVALPRTGAAEAVQASLTRLADVRVSFVTDRPTDGEEPHQAADAHAVRYVDEDGVVHETTARATAQRLLDARPADGGTSLALCWRLARSLTDGQPSGAAIIDLDDRALLPPSARGLHRYLCCAVRRPQRMAAAAAKAQAAAKDRRGPRVRRDPGQPAVIELDQLAAVALGPPPTAVAAAARAQRQQDLRKRSPQAIAAAQAQAARRRGDQQAAEAFAQAAQAAADAAAELAARRRRVLELVDQIDAVLGQAWRITRPASTAAVPKAVMPGKGAAARKAGARQPLLAPAVTVSRLG
ncbi:hypothetical protein [Azospirillum brasilense]|uniref:Uncharacterized protein n=1 Tax=Azospirillum brasilense TaxID=192 RepID=A0A6L3B1N1_AZOBR|nr:hypothetical protein [Azospirillum brasilense]KAA0686224.1 hypothetical protein DS837_11040 [Azospirillum brasilense]